jgi:hypothetical protein
MFFGGTPGLGPECSFCNLLRDGINMFEDLFPTGVRVRSVDAGHRATDNGFVTVLHFEDNSPSLGLEFINPDVKDGEQPTRHMAW